MKRRFLFALLLNIAVLQTAIAQTAIEKNQRQNTTEYSSGKEQVTLVELYTSEGCSSCPPADRWLSSLKQQPALWEKVVPLSLHVDYWNYIGWNDRFAKRVHSDRQRSYHYEGASQGVYTPGFFVDGKEWRGYFTGDRLRQNSAQKPGELRIIVENGHFKAHYTPDENTTISGQPYKLMVALLGMNLRTVVKQGENQGKTLRHDFVVLDLKQARGHSNQWQGKLPRREKNQDYAIAAWVTEKHSMTPIQAVGGPLK